jgi:hypothetical protein
MTCSEARPFVSSVLDGQGVPAEAARHIADCAACRQAMRDYAEIGAEIRLLSLTESAPELPSRLRRELQRKPSRRRWWTRAVLIPRLVVWAAVAMALCLIPAASALHGAGSAPLWFQFQLGPRGGTWTPNAAKAGFDQHGSWMFLDNSTGRPQPREIQFYWKIREIRQDQVRLKVTAWDPGKSQKPAREQSVIYHPGRTTEVFTDGPTLQLRGEVLDHQPRLASGFPLEPGPDSLVLVSPVLVEGDHVLANLRGASTMVDSQTEIILSAAGVGRFRIGLKPVKGAAVGEADWSQLVFNMNGREHLVLADSPITGGEQPRKVWVQFERDPNAISSFSTSYREKAR